MYDPRTAFQVGGVMRPNSELETRNAEQTTCSTFRVRRSVFGNRLTFAVLFLTAIGCGGAAVKPIDNDPLLGPGSTAPLSKAPPPEKEKKSSVARPGPSPDDLRRQLNELPAPSPTTSNAELAAGRTQT